MSWTIWIFVRKSKYFYFLYILLSQKKKKKVILPHKHHTCISVSTLRHLKEGEDLLQRGIVLRFYNLQDCVLIWGWFIFCFEACLQKHKVFQHKAANMSHVSDAGALGFSPRQFSMNRPMCQLVWSSSILSSWGSFMLHLTLKYWWMWKIEYLDSSPYSPKNWTSWKGAKWFGDISVVILWLKRGGIASDE